MIFSAPDPATDPHVARVLLGLQRDAYAVEASLVGDDRLPPLQQDEVGLTAFRGRWVMAWDGVDLVGAIAWQDSGDVVEIEKLMVRPSAHRRGIASGLLTHAIGAAGRRHVAVATGRDNAPGRALYGKHGFDVVGDEQVPPGIWITRLRRPASGLDPGA